MFTPSLFPFYSLSNDELIDNFSFQTSSPIIDLELRKILNDALSEDIMGSLEFKYYTPSQLDHLANKYHTNMQLSIFHVNIRSLNANYNKLFNFCQCLNFKFDIIILSNFFS